MSKTYIADKDTLDAVNGKIGTKDDVPSPNPISLFAGIKQLLKGLSDHMATWTGDRAAKVDYLVPQLAAEHRPILHYQRHNGPMQGQDIWIS